MEKLFRRYFSCASIDAFSALQRGKELICTFQRSELDRANSSSRVLLGGCRYESRTLLT